MAGLVVMARRQWGGGEHIVNQLFGDILHHGQLIIEIVFNLLDNACARECKVARDQYGYGSTQVRVLWMANEISIKVGVTRCAAAGVPTARPSQDRASPGQPSEDTSANVSWRAVYRKSRERRLRKTGVGPDDFFLVHCVR